LRLQSRWKIAKQVVTTAFKTISLFFFLAFLASVLLTEERISYERKWWLFLGRTLLKRKWYGEDCG